VIDRFDSIPKSIISYIIVIISGIALIAPSYSSENRTHTLILAADMPDIFDAQSGKYAELKTLVVDSQKASSVRPFLIFGGGSLGPSAMSAFDKGSHIIDVLNTIEPDIMGVTKREFSYLTDELSLRAYEAAFPIVTSNVIDTRSKQTPDGLNQFFLLKRDNISIGFISVVNSRLIEEYLLTNVDVADPIETITRASKTLKSMGANVVLLHYSYPFEFIPELLDKSVIDIAFLSDTRLQAHYIDMVTAHPHILHLKQPGGAIKAKFSLADGFTLMSNEFVPLASLTPAPKVQNVVNNYYARLTRMLDEPLGTWAANFSTRREAVRGKENAFANFIVDAMREFSDADIAIINGGSIRGDKTYKQGDSILKKDIATELPFRSRLQVIEVSGDDVLQALEVGVSKVEDLKGGFPHVSGMSVKYNRFAPVGERIVSVMIGNRRIEREKMYQLATTDYLANGGDGYTVFKREGSIRQRIEHSILIADLVAETILAKQTLNGRIENRMVEQVTPTSVQRGAE
jgi:2',3'-cyclic-nucleotide 2'-phosphodiesterase (5'-nucleotidase family)